MPFNVGFYFPYAEAAMTFHNPKLYPAVQGCAFLIVVRNEGNPSTASGVL